MATSLKNDEFIVFERGVHQCFKAIQYAKWRFGGNIAIRKQIHHFLFAGKGDRVRRKTYSEFLEINEVIGWKNAHVKITINFYNDWFCNVCDYDSTAADG